MDLTNVKTGDFLLVEGTGVLSEIIEDVTGGKFSHVGVFFWENGVLMISEEWEGTGFMVNPAETRCADLSKTDGSLFVGVVPGVSGQQSAVMSVVNQFRHDPALDPYGYWTLPLVAATDDLGLDIQPDRVQAVCSVYGQRVCEACGMRFNTLMSPSDFPKICSQVLPLS